MRVGLLLGILLLLGGVVGPLSLGESQAFNANVGATWCVGTCATVPTPSPTPAPDGGLIWHPSAAFTYALDGLSGLVNFFAPSNLSSDSWLWNFGDGITAQTQNATHAFAVSGFYSTYLVSLKHCTHGFCSTTTQTLTILNWPIVFLVLMVVLIAVFVGKAIASGPKGTRTFRSGRRVVLTTKVPKPKIYKPKPLPRIKIIRK